MKLIDFLVEYEKGIYYEKIVFDNNVFEYDETYGVYRMTTSSMNLMEYFRNKQDLSEEVIILDNIGKIDKVYEISKIDNIIPTAEYLDGTKRYDNEELGNKLNELINVINEMRCR